MDLVKVVNRKANITVSFNSKVSQIIIKLHQKLCIKS